MSFKKLLVDHSYYCSPGCYSSAGCIEDYSSWKQFIAENGDANPDYNLLFRWDVVEEDGAYKLYLFTMQQRRALPFTYIVSIRAEDETEILAYLQIAWRHMQELWAGVSGVSLKEEA